MKTEADIRADERHRVLAQANTAHGSNPREAPPCSTAFTAEPTSRTWPDTWLTRAPLSDRIRARLTARPILPQGEALVIFADRHVARYDHACVDCVGADALIIQLAGGPMEPGPAANGSGPSAGPDPSS